jgi:phosphocarrier protein HPr
MKAARTAKFVKLANDFEAEVTVTREGQTVDARSIMGLMMLAAGPGCEIEIRADGRDAQAAVDALSELITSRFDEDR